MFSANVTKEIEEPVAITVGASLITSFTKSVIS